MWRDALLLSFDLGGRATRMCAIDSAALTSRYPAMRCRDIARGGVAAASLAPQAVLPAGTPALLLALDASDSGSGNTISLWRYAPADNTLSGPLAVPVARCAIACAACIAQPPGGAPLASHARQLAPRAQYDGRALVFNHTVVQPGGQTGIRWYELRAPFRRGPDLPARHVRAGRRAALDGQHRHRQGRTTSRSPTRSRPRPPRLKHPLHGPRAYRSTRPHAAGRDHRQRQRRAKYPGLSLALLSGCPVARSGRRLHLLVHPAIYPDQRPGSVANTHRFVQVPALQVIPCFMRLVPLLLLSALLCGITSPAAQKPIYTMSPQEAGDYIASMYQAQPDLRKRIAAIGRQNIGQPYSLNLLGEFPYELHDKLPLYSLEKKDCVVFAEHTYAMALSQSWEQFFWTLQRIRYKDGVIGVASRNHYTEVDWNVNNRWLLTEITAALATRAGQATR
ncbi:DUF1460 domain-containing protein [Massilia sp. B-10]|nr:DUF1460 domain-containing protein [Massilia sp. B-10]